MIKPCPRKHFRGGGHLCVAGKKRFQAKLREGLNRAVERLGAGCGMELCHCYPKAK